MIDLNGINYKNELATALMYCIKGECDKCSRFASIQNAGVLTAMYCRHKLMEESASALIS
jgi:hypothetical protein